MYYMVIFGMNYGYQLLRYFCSVCNTPLMETYKSVDIIRSSEECPKCGSLLSENLKRRQVSQQDNSNSITTSSSLLSTRFHTVSRLSFDIKKIDSILAFEIGECVSLIGNYSKILIERLCIRALLSERHGGFGSHYVIIIDAGNSSDIYSCVNLARQYGLDLKDMLKRIVVSRPFTIYQLANLVTCELPKAVQKFDTKTIIISDMLRMFLQDSQTRIKEARPIIKEIINSLRRISNNACVIVSFNYTLPSEYYQMLIPYFDKCIHLTNDASDNSLLVEMSYYKKKDNIIIRRLQQSDLEIIHQK
jgi:Rad51